jgi:hypothetical protein
LLPEVIQFLQKHKAVLAKIHNLNLVLVPVIRSSSNLPRNAGHEHRPPPKPTA